MLGINKIKSLMKKVEGPTFVGHFKREQSLTNVKRDWGIMMSVFLLFVVASLIFSVYLFSQISRGEIFVVQFNNTEGVETIDKNLLQETISFFDNKEERFNELRDNTPSFVDPSL